MMRSQLVRNYLFIFDRNDGRDREETGQIELSDDHEAFAFGEQVIREMLQGSSRQYEGCAMEVQEGERIVGRIPFGELSAASLTLATRRCHMAARIGGSAKLPRHDLDVALFEMAGPGCPFEVTYPRRRP
jgi:hypothetical protein